MATTCRGRSADSSAHSTTAPAERSHPSREARRTTSVASIASGRSRSSSRNEPRTFSSTSSRASSTATSVSAATAARCRNSTASGSGRPGWSNTTPPIRSSPDAIGTSATISDGTGATRPRACSPM